MPAHLLVDAARGQAQVAHRHQDPPLRRLEPVADVRQRPADDDRHRIVEVALLELLLDVQRLGSIRKQYSGIHGQSIPLQQVSSEAGSRPSSPITTRSPGARIPPSLSLKSERCIVPEPTRFRNRFEPGLADHKSRFDKKFTLRADSPAGRCRLGEVVWHGADRGPRRSRFTQSLTASLDRVHNAAT